MSAYTPLLHPSGCPCCAGSSDTDKPHAADSPPTVQYASGLHRVADLDLNALLTYRNAQTSTGVFSNGTARWNIDAAVGQPGVNTLDQLRNSDAGLGTPVTLQYHFMSALPSYYKEGSYFGPASSFRPLSEDERKIVVEELAKISAVTGVTFVESSSGGGKTLSFAVTELTASGLGYNPAFQPNYGSGTITSVTAIEQAGDVYFRRLGLDNYTKDGLTAAERAGIGTLVRHEIGHALGLSHPFDGPVVLPTSAQNKFYTMMGYSDVTDYYGIADGAYLKAEMNSMGILDLLALQKLYGANPTYNVGDNTYSWAQDTAFRTAVYDAGGIDLIDLSASTMRSQIDLSTVELSSINIRDTEAERLVNTPPGWTNTLVTYRGENNLGIVGTIENVKAGAGNDRVNGNSAANDISGGAGNDSVWGGAGDDRLYLGSGDDRVVAGSGNDYVDGGRGIDVAGLFGSRANHTITRQSDGGLKVVGPEGTDTYLNMEFLAFNDGGKVGLWMNADVKLGGGFDETFYLAKNPDVAAAVARGALSSGFAHWQQWGQAEGRVAVDARFDPLYDEVGYLAMNPDVAAAVAGGALRSGYDHYLAYGKAEGRALTPLFDRDYYLAKNADVKAAGLDAWTHFMNYGWREGRDPSAYLDVSAYLDANADLKAAGVNPLTHYLQYGQGEGRLLVATTDLGLDWTYSG